MRSCVLLLLFLCGHHSLSFLFSLFEPFSFLLGLLLAHSFLFFFLLLSEFLFLLRSDFFSLGLFLFEPLELFLLLGPLFSPLVNVLHKLFIQRTFFSFHPFSQIVSITFSLRYLRSN